MTQNPLPPSSPVDPGRAFSGAVDLSAAKPFYAGTLGLEVAEAGGMLRLGVQQ